MSECKACGTPGNRQISGRHAARTQEYFDILIKPLRFVARKYGYALAVHGSVGADIDLVACPWRDSACSAESLFEAIRDTAKQIIGIAEVNHPATKKPGGRLAWAIHLTPDFGADTYIDLSVMPIVKEPVIEKKKRKKK